MIAVPANATGEFRARLQRHCAGEALGVYSLCSAREEVLAAAMRQAIADDSMLLMESTSNQVDQYGGYTGMRPADFAAFVGRIADAAGMDRARLLLGGDHLGPNRWRDEPAEEAMAKADVLVRDYVQAGFAKIHLDASMPLSGDGDLPILPDEIVARRATRMARAAEQAAAQAGIAPPVYVIGTEVPIPGGAQGAEMDIAPTTPEAARQTIEATRAAFAAEGLEEAWQRVVAVVVQPGVEFGDDGVHLYNRRKAVGLSRMIASCEGLVYEAHSTDYQSGAALREMVEDHFAILKTGPWATFAYREALFALARIEEELFHGTPEVLSGLPEALEAAMCADPSSWRKYYRGDENELRLKRRYSLCDRARYYWSHPGPARAIAALCRNLAGVTIPLSLISQYFPTLFEAVQESRIAPAPHALIEGRIREVLALYAGACLY